MLRIGFVSCVRLGLSCMEAIDAAGGSLRLVVTLADDLGSQKSGRVRLDEYCRHHRVPLVKVRNINAPAAVAALKAAALDWLFIVGWSQIARQEVLATARLGVLGMHPTLLPVGRGRAAVPWAILNGLTRTGVSLFRLDGGVDTGPVAAQVVIPVGPRETATTLYGKVLDAHRSLLLAAWPRIAAGTLEFQPQDERQASVWPGRTPEEGCIDRGASLAVADRLVRAVTHPYPGAFIDTPVGRLRVWSATPVPDQPPPAPVRGADGRWRIGLADGCLVVDDGGIEPAS